MLAMSGWAWMSWRRHSAERGTGVLDSQGGLEVLVALVGGPLHAV